MLKPFATAAAIAITACLPGHPAPALTQTTDVLAQATPTPTTTPKAPATNSSKSTGQAPAPQTSAAQTGLVDTNSASQADLQTLSGSVWEQGEDDHFRSRTLVYKNIIPSSVYNGIKDKMNS